MQHVLGPGEPVRFDGVNDLLERAQAIAEGAALASGTQSTFTLQAGDWEMVPSFAGSKIVHYNFFDDPDDGGTDAIYGLYIALMKFVNIFKSAARRYGT